MSKTSRSRKKATISSAFGSYINMGVNLFRGFLLFPLYLKYIDADTYGFWLATGGVVSLLAFFDIGISKNIQQKMSRYFALSKYKEMKTYFINGLIINTGTTTIIAIIALIVGLLLPFILSIPKGSSDIISNCFYISVLSFLMVQYNQYFTTFNSAILLPLMPLLLASIMNILGIVITILMLISGAGLYSLPVGQFIASTATLIGLIILTISRYRRISESGKFSFSIIKSLLIDTGPLFLGKSGQTIVKQIEPVLITIIIGPTATTAYVITKKAADFISIALNIPIGSIFPSMVNFMSSENEQNIRKLITRILMYLTITGTILFSMYLNMNGSFIKLWIGNEMYLGDILVLWISVGLLLRIIMVTLSDIIFGSGKIIFSSLLLFFEGISRVLLMSILLSMYGILGAAVGLAISCFAAIVIIIIKYNKKITSDILTNNYLTTFIGYIIYIICINILFNLSNLQMNSWSLFVMWSIFLMIIYFIPFALSNKMKRLVYFN